MVVLNQPAAIAEHIHKCVAGLYLMAIGETKAVGAGCHRFVAAQLNAAAVDVPLRLAGQEACEVIADAGGARAGLAREGGQQQGVVAVQRHHLIGIAAAQGSVPLLKQLRHSPGIHRRAGFGGPNRQRPAQPEQHGQAGAEPRPGKSA